MSRNAFAIAMIVLAGGIAVSEATARTCQTVTITRYVKVCKGYSYKHRCYVKPVTTTRQICTVNTPTIPRRFDDRRRRFGN